jgi:hypothetical protein
MSLFGIDASPDLQKAIAILDYFFVDYLIMRGSRKIKSIRFRAKRFLQKAILKDPDFFVNTIVDDLRKELRKDKSNRRKEKSSSFRVKRRELKMKLHGSVFNVRDGAKNPMRQIAALKRKRNDYGKFLNLPIFDGGIEVLSPPTW